MADAERLPFRDASVDLVYVHDGLYHLERPWSRSREMARVARRAVSITEPAEASLTAGPSASGGRSTRRRLATSFDGRGSTTSCGNCEITASSPSRHTATRCTTGTGRDASFARSRIPFTVAREGRACGALNVAGRYGNKLTVQAIRVSSTDGSRNP